MLGSRRGACSPAGARPKGDMKTIRAVIVVSVMAILVSASVPALAADTAYFSSSQIIHRDQTGEVEVVVLRNTGAGTGTVRYYSEDATALAGSDYVAVSGMLTFKDGQTEARFSVSLRNDPAVEDDEYFWLKLSDPTGSLADVGPHARFDIFCSECRDPHAPSSVSSGPESMTVDGPPPPMPPQPSPGLQPGGNHAQVANSLPPAPLPPPQAAAPAAPPPTAEPVPPAVAAPAPLSAPAPQTLELEPRTNTNGPVVSFLKKNGGLLLPLLSVFILILFVLRDRIGQLVRRRPAD